MVVVHLSVANHYIPKLYVSPYLLILGKVSDITFQKLKKPLNHCNNKYDQLYRAMVQERRC